MLQSKRSTRASEGKQAALDVLSVDEKVRLNLDIPKQTMRQLKMRAVEGDSVSDIIRKLVDDYLYLSK